MSAESSLPISAEDWPRIEAALDALLDLPEAARAAEVTRISRGDDALAQQLRSLLAQMGGDDPVLDRPALALAGESDADADHDGALPAGTRIGSYRILSLIGRGGMGEVYRAERIDGEFDQRIALKLVRSDGRAQRERFRSERQTLARLEHPGIARLIDGGIADDGRPYMAMELVEGAPITDWCRQRACSLDERLRLFAEICAAVAYAHQNLVVHRDLKPGNVLVSADGRVRLLDFGIAKLLDTPGEQPTRNVPMTPGYAAPEQITGAAITTATDVYALGMLLFELLTGGPPWKLGDLPMLAALDKVLRDTPPLASRHAAAQAAPPVPPALLRGDLDAIIAKAVRKEPERRYDSVSALARDLARSRARQPVSAREGARLYAVGRFVSRYRLPVASAALAVSALIAGIVATTGEAHLAQREARRANATRDFLISVFRASDPRIASGKPRGEITAKELLDANVDRIDQGFAQDPDTRIALLGVFSEIYDQLEDGDRSGSLLDRRIALARATHGDLDPVVIDGLIAQGTGANYANDPERAAQRLAEADALIHRAGLDHALQRGRWWLLKSQTLASDSALAEQRVAALEQAIRLLTAVGPAARELLVALSDLGGIRYQQGNFEQAVQQIRAAIAVCARIGGEGDGQAIVLYGNLAKALEQQDDFDGAENAYARAADIAQKTFGSHYWSYWFAVASEARMEHLRGQRDQALARFAALMPELPSALQAGSSLEETQAAYAREMYGERLSAEGRPAEAVALLETAQSEYRARPLYDYYLRRLQLTLADAYDALGRDADARRLLTTTLADTEAHEGPSSRGTLAARERWGRFLLDHHESAAAEPVLKSVLDSAGPRRLAATVQAEADLARLELVRGDAAAAVGLIRKAEADYGALHGVRDVRLEPLLWRIEAEAEVRSGDLAHSRTLAERALAASASYDAADSPAIREARRLIVVAGKS